MSDEENTEMVRDDVEMMSKTAEEIDEKSKRIVNQMEGIERMSRSIGEVLLEIQHVTGESEILMSALNLVRKAPPLSLEAGNDSSEDELLLPEHSLKLDGKMRQIHRVEEENKELDNDIKTWEDQLSVLINDECETKKKMLQAENEIREYKLFSTQRKKEIEFLQDMITERKKEIRELNSLRLEAEAALKKLKAMETPDTDDDAKDVNSHQAEVLALESEIAKTKKRMFDFREYIEDEKRKLEDHEELNEESANWRTERTALQNTLTDLKREIKQLKGSLMQKDTIDRRRSIEGSKLGDNLSFEDQEKYGWLIRKWSGKTYDEEESGDLNALWERIQVPRLELARLMEENDKLLDEIEAARKQQDRVIARCRNKGVSLMNQAQVGQQRFEEDEKVLLDKIKKMKMKLAQIRWKRNSL